MKMNFDFDFDFIVSKAHRRFTHNKIQYYISIYLSIIIILFLSLITPCFAQNAGGDSPVLQEQNLDYAIGKVQKIISESSNKVLQESLGGSQTTQVVEVKVLSGKYKNKIFKTENQLTNNPAYDIKIRPGSRVVLDIEENQKTGHPVVYIADLERVPALLILTGLFFLLIMAIGGIKGLKSLISLLITSLLVFFILIPGILSKFPIIPLTVVIALISTLSTMFIVGGMNLKSISASLGTIGGLIIAGLMSTLIIKIAPLTGITDQESIILWSSRPDLNFTGLLTSAMIIGSLGAIMDVGISIASSIAEIKSIDPTLTKSQLIKSGLNVGKDIMGAMSNTLILAYIGGFMPLILLAANAPLLKLLNLNSIATEITAALVGSIGIVMCVPITALISSHLMSRNNTEKN